MLRRRPQRNSPVEYYYYYYHYCDDDDDDDYVNNYQVDTRSNRKAGCWVFGEYGNTVSDCQTHPDYRSFNFPFDDDCISDTKFYSPANSTGNLASTLYRARVAAQRRDYSGVRRERDQRRVPRADEQR